MSRGVMTSGYESRRLLGKPTHICFIKLPDGRAYLANQIYTHFMVLYEMGGYSKMRSWYFLHSTEPPMVTTLKLVIDRFSSLLRFSS